MRICWDNLERLRYNKSTDTFRCGRVSYYYFDNCKHCNEPYIGQKHNKFCTNECRFLFYTKEKHPGYGRIGIDNPRFGVRHKKDSIIKMVKSKTGNNNPNWNNYTSYGIPLYDTYAPQLQPIEQCRRNEEDSNVLEVKCTYCGKWYVPTLSAVKNRIDGINIDSCRFYCSDNCKHACPLFGKSPAALIKRDMIASGRILPNELNREAQPDLRKMVFARDDHRCLKCNSDGPLHCHHILPVAIEPIESADIDNCITLCVNCHKTIHTQPGCGYSELKCG